MTILMSFSTWEWLRPNAKGLPLFLTMLSRILDLSTSSLLYLTIWSDHSKNKVSKQHNNNQLCPLIPPNFFPIRISCHPNPAGLWFLTLQIRRFSHHLPSLLSAPLPLIWVMTSGPESQSDHPPDADKVEPHASNTALAYNDKYVYVAPLPIPLNLTNVFSAAVLMLEALNA